MVNPLVPEFNDEWDSEREEEEEAEMWGREEQESEDADGEQEAEDAEHSDALSCFLLLLYLCGACLFACIFV